MAAGGSHAPGDPARPAPGIDLDQIVRAEVDAINERRSSLKRELLTVAGTGPNSPALPAVGLAFGRRHPLRFLSSACCRH